MSQRSETPTDPSVGQLMSQLSEQSSQLVRKELQLAQLELKETVKHAGIGAGLFSGAGVLAVLGLASAIATAMIALDLALPLWLSALIVTLAVFAAAGVAGLLGKRQVEQVSPTPERTVTNVKRDVQEIKEGAHHGRSH